MATTLPAGRESALVRRSGRARSTSPTAASSNETLDVFPADKPRSPVVVFIHGGYWKGMDKSQHSFLVPALRAPGAAVPNYALCPKMTI